MKKTCEIGKAYKWTKDEIDDIIGYYIDDNESLNTVAKRYGVSYASIRRLLLKNNIDLHLRGGQNLYFANYHFFDTIDTEEKAYWLGFIAADGCIYKKHNNLSIKLARKDKHHLSKFVNDLSANYLVRDYQLKNGYKYSTVRLFNSHLVNSLAKYGVVPNKTFIMEPIKLSQELMRHYWRGFFDGDGNIACYDKGKQWGITLVGVNKEIINSFKSFVCEYCDTKASIHKGKSGVYSFRVKGNKVAPSAIHALYKDANIYLDRKYEKYLDMCQDSRVVD